jgi:predicted transcriptional regulator/DNA-binding CsgD family transcriptional regulator
MAPGGHPHRVTIEDETQPSRRRPAEPGMLAAVGVGGFDEEVYRELLTRADATPAALAEGLGSAEARVAAALVRLRSLGLVNRMSGRRLRYTAVDPEAAVEALVRHRAGELEQVRDSVVALSSRYHAVRRQQGSGGTIELIDGPLEIGRWFARLQHQVRDEMLVLDRPPYALAAANPVEPVVLAKGVRWRAIYAPESLEVPGALEEVEELVSRGERGRVLPGLPIKLAIADRRVALLALDLDIQRAQAAVIRESTLLTALLELFEAYWQRAVPIGIASTPADDGPDDDRRLAQLLAAGLTDSAIARQLGLSTRTMRRRMRQLHDELSAANRFQAGVQAGRRGWL